MAQHNQNNGSLRIKIMLCLSAILAIATLVKSATENENIVYKNDTECQEKWDATNTCIQDYDSEHKCCLVKGYQDITQSSVCIKLNKTLIQSQENRIDIIKKLSTETTGVTLDCGIPKKFESTCGAPNPSDSKDCNKNGKTCCYVEVKSDSFSGKACRAFNSELDINTIGEAVVAAKTVGAELIVDCFNRRFQAWFTKTALIVLLMNLY